MFKLMPASIVLVLMTVAAGVSGYITYNIAHREQPPAPQPTIQLEKIAKLAMLKVSVADILKAKDGEGMTGVEGIWLVKGDALLTVDMREAKVVTNDPQTRKAVICLPKPVVYQPRVDHSKTETYQVNKGIFVFGTAAESHMRDEAMRKAQELVNQTANSPEIIQLARDVASQVVQGIYKMVDWDVTIVWADQEQK